MRGKGRRGEGEGEGERKTKREGEGGGEGARKGGRGEGWREEGGKCYVINSDDYVIQSSIFQHNSTDGKIFN